MTEPKSIWFKHGTIYLTGWFEDRTATAAIIKKINVRHSQLALYDEELDLLSKQYRDHVVEFMHKCIVAEHWFTLLVGLSRRCIRGIGLSNLSHLSKVIEQVSLNQLETVARLGGLDAMRSMVTPVLHDVHAKASARISRRPMPLIKVTRR